MGNQLTDRFRTRLQATFTRLASLSQPPVKVYTVRIQHDLNETKPMVMIYDEDGTNCVTWMEFPDANSLIMELVEGTFMVQIHGAEASWIAQVVDGEVQSGD